MHVYTTFCLSIWKTFLLFKRNFETSFSKCFIHLVNVCLVKHTFSKYPAFRPSLLCFWQVGPAYFQGWSETSWARQESLASRGSTCYQTHYHAKETKDLLLIFKRIVSHSCNPVHSPSILPPQYPSAESKEGSYLGKREEGKSSRSLLCNSWNSSNVRWI